MTALRQYAGLLAACTVLTACVTPGAGEGTRTDATSGAAVSSKASPPGVNLGALKGVKLPDYVRAELPNGIVLLLAERHDVPMVGFQAVLRGGALEDPDGKPGVASLLGSLLEKGAGDRDALGFASAVESVGGRFGVAAGVENLQIAGSFLKQDTDLMLELLGDVLMRPRFDAAEFEKIRRRSIEFIRAAKDSDPRRLIATYGAAALFGNHPYGRPTNGDETSLAAIEREDVQVYYRNHIGAERLILAVVGDFETADMQRKLTAMLGSWRRAATDVAAPPPTARRSGRRVVVIDKPGATQTYFWIGNVGVSRSFERRAELNLANTVFGGRFTSMLNTELRIKSGLSYGARSRIGRPQQRGSLAMVSFTQTDTTVAAIDLALETLERLRSDGLDDAALQSAKAYVLGQDPTRFETADQLAGQIATLEFFGLPRSYVDDYGPAVVAADSAGVADVIREVYPESNDLVFVMIGAAATIREQVRKYGDVEVFSLAAPSFQLN